jgi:uncharacterized membrane protein (UPF0127 family)
MKFFGGIIFVFLFNFTFAQESQKLERKKYNVCGVSFNLEIADDDDERAIGMMYRKGVPHGEGMIFLFNEAQNLSFWMKNVTFDLDIGYFNEKNVLLNFHTMKATSLMQKDEFLARYPSDGLAKYAVEVYAGFYSKHVGHKCRLEAAER